MHQTDHNANINGLMKEPDWESYVGALHDTRASALLICNEGPRRVALQAMIEAAGARLLGSVGIAEASARLDQTAAVGIIILNAEAESLALSALFARIGHMSEVDGTAIVAAITPELVDEAFWALSASAASILCAPDESELAAALALAACPASGPRLHDIGRESETARLQRLSEEVSRIARTLASLSGRTDTASAASTGQVAEATLTYSGETELENARHRSGTAPVTARDIRDILRLRRMRDQFFPGDLFADPAWDMLLDLMAARLSGQRVSVSSLCIAAAVPATTALRWIKALTDSGLFLRQADPSDGRRVFIALSDHAAEAMNNYFAAALRAGKTLLA